MRKLGKGGPGGPHSETLEALATELFAPDEFVLLRSIARTEPLDYDELVDFDKSIGGAGLAWVQRREDDPFEPYEIVDRDVFRPLQYCEAYFQMDPDDAEWLTRALVEMSCAHIEALLKRIAGLPLVPYGSALFNWAVRRRLATQTFEHLKRFGIIYSSAKHDFNHAASTHRFSMPDAVLAYVIARRLATELYALANLRTSLDS